MLRPRDPELASAALALYARVLAAKTLDAAAHQLVSHLATEWGYDRASFGLRLAGHTRLLASSGLDPADPQTELPGLLVGAMDEAMEQRLPLAYPVSTEARGGGPDPILLEQAALQRHVGGAVASIPLGFDGEVFAAVNLERHQGPPILAGELARLEQVLVLAAPALRWISLGTQPWHQRLRRAARKGLTALRQPRKRGMRRILVGAVAVLLFACLAPLEHTVGGRARVEGAQQRVLTAPADGFIKTAHVRPGDRVKVGAALVDLIDEDLQLASERWTSQLVQHENAYAAAMAKSDRVGASTSFAKVTEAQAQLALVEGQRMRGRITAPIEALVIQGDLSQSIGAPVRQGDPLLTLATTDSYRVIVEIDEVDIARVRPGQSGRLVVSSQPWGSQDLRVERITPLAKAVDGRNVFEVEARLVGAPDELRPGLLGRVDLVVGRLPPIWSWSRQAVDRARLAWWSWAG